MKNLNNKGYLLIEIILASALAIGMAYFMIRLTITVKNKNDDLLVKSLTSTDQGIIYNYFMKKVYDPSGNGQIDQTKISTSGQSISYEGKVITRLNKYAKFGTITTAHDGDYIIIPITVTNLEDENFDVVIYQQNRN